jgi:hypothetical protein
MKEDKADQDAAGRRGHGKARTGCCVVLAATFVGLAALSAADAAVVQTPAAGVSRRLPRLRQAAEREQGASTQREATSRLSHAAKGRQVLRLVESRRVLLLRGGGDAPEDGDEHAVEDTAARESTQRRRGRPAGRGGRGGAKGAARGGRKSTSVKKESETTAAEASGTDPADAEKASAQGSEPATPGAASTATAGDEAAGEAVVENVAEDASAAKEAPQGKLALPADDFAAAVTAAAPSAAPGVPLGLAGEEQAAAVATEQQMQQQEQQQQQEQEQQQQQQQQHLPLETEQEHLQQLQRAEASSQQRTHAQAHTAPAEEQHRQHPPPRMQSISPTQNIPGMHSPGTGTTMLPGEVDLPAELQMPPSMQHMYHWEAPDGNQFIMDPLAAAGGGGGSGGAGGGGVGSGLGADGPQWQPGPHRGLGDQLYALGGYDGGGQLSTVESLDTQTGLWRTEAPMLSKRGALAGNK